jgi:hypothetical protein
MKAWSGIAMVMALTVCATLTSAAHEPQPAADAQAKPGAGAPDDNMASYRKLAADTLTAFKAHDMPTAKKNARMLEVAWDKGEKTLEKKSPDVWGQIDKAMDAFIKPVMHDKSPDPAKVQTAYDAFIAKLQLAVKSDAAKD